MLVLTQSPAQCNGCRSTTGLKHNRALAMASKRLGLSCAISTPFTPAARVDTARLADHANWCLREGCDSITLFGTTGEGAAVGVVDRQASVKGLLAAGIGPTQLLSGVTACRSEER